jgi:hypothetical protein
MMAVVRVSFIDGQDDLAAFGAHLPDDSPGSNLCHAVIAFLREDRKTRSAGHSADLDGLGAISAPVMEVNSMDARPRI